MSFIDLIKKKWHDLRKWYIETVELIAKLIKQILLSLPKAILGILGFFVFIFAAEKIGWWVLPIYIVLMFLALWVHSKFTKKKTDYMKDMDIDHFSKSEIEDSFRRIDAIIESNIFAPENDQHPLVRSAFIELLICLRDLMYKTEKYTSRVTFDDDIVKNVKKINDITDVIKYVRDALCHLDSDKHYLEKGNIKATYNVIRGKGTLVKINDYEQTSEFSDDLCFFFGSQRIYLKRHIIRAIEEVKSKFLPILESSS